MTSKTDRIHHPLSGLVFENINTLCFVTSLKMEEKYNLRSPLFRHHGQLSQLTSQKSVLRSLIIPLGDVNLHHRC